MAEERRSRLGDTLVKKGLLSEKELAGILEKMKKTGRSLTQLLIDSNLISEGELLKFFEENYGFPSIKLTDYLLDTKVATEIDEKTARRYKIIPLFKVENRLTVAMADPLDLHAIDFLKSRTNLQIDPVIAPENDIVQFIDRCYGSANVLKELAEGQDKEGELEVVKEGDASEGMPDDAQQAPVVKMVNLTIIEAIKQRASDIHIEPEEHRLRIRYRIDGILREIMSPPKNLHAAVVSRIKILSEMNIAERRLPQDGRCQIKTGDKVVDLRVSTFPSIYGEKVVMRILDRSRALISLEKLGFSEKMEQEYRRVIVQPNGIILVTGPTGSGKTSTLYATLNAVSTPEKNIITLEDPVEYRLAGITQGQINPRAGLNFAQGLRSILRQDPNIIMVGEIRDIETAEIAIQAALTGHLVLSTLHTNDSASALARLVDMGLEPFLVASSVLGVVAQRLVRRLCPGCKEVFTPPPELLDEVGWKGKNTESIYHGKGCRQCNNTGYQGRMGVYEFFSPDEGIQRMVLAKSSAREIKNAAQAKGMKTLRQDGLEKVSRGLTTIEEILRETPGDR